MNLDEDKVALLYQS